MDAIVSSIALVMSAAYTGLGGVVIPQLFLRLLREQIESRAAVVELLLPSCCIC